MKNNFIHNSTPKSLIQSSIELISLLSFFVLHPLKDLFLKLLLPFILQHVIFDDYDRTDSQEKEA